MLALRALARAFARSASARWVSLVTPAESGVPARLTSLASAPDPRLRGDDESMVHARSRTLPTTCVLVAPAKAGAQAGTAAVANALGPRLRGDDKSIGLTRSRTLHTTPVFVAPAKACCSDRAATQGGSPQSHESWTPAFAGMTNQVFSRAPDWRSRANKPGSTLRLRRGAEKLAAVCLLLTLAACSQAPSPPKAPEFAEAPPPPAMAESAAQPPFQFEDGRSPSGTCGTGSEAGCSAPEAASGDLADKAMPPDPDRSCRTDADCAVRNIGNCCGYFPACVNAQAPTFPEQVKAACEAQGLSSICGFQDITACACIEGRCEAAPGGGELK
mgnify:FL=1